MGGGDSDSGAITNNVQFGAISQAHNFSNFFGGQKTFNLGAGSSSFDIITNSMDLGSYMTNETTQKGGDSSGGGVGTIAADVAASVGVGVGGGSGSAGSVDKTTANTTTDTMSRVASAGGGYALPLAIAGVGGVVLLFAMRKKRK